MGASCSASWSMLFPYVNQSGSITNDERSTLELPPAICTSFQMVEKDAFAVIVLNFSLGKPESMVL